MPQTEEEKTEVQAGFLAMANFPRLIGAIDCTHVKISSRGGENAEFYRNRKGYFSLNVQVVCDSKHNIRDIVVRWPGSCHDSHIFRNSFLKERFENGEFGQLVLIGDSGYALQKFLMTQLPNPVTRSEQMYNQSLISTRTIIERTFGIWKRRFPVLAIGMRCKKTTLIQEIIIATAVLNNIAVSRREQDVFEDLPDEIIDLPNVDEVNMDENGNEIQLAQRRFINYFQNFL